MITPATIPCHEGVRRHGPRLFGHKTGVTIRGLIARTRSTNLNLVGTDRPPIRLTDARRRMIPTSAAAAVLVLVAGVPVSARSDLTAHITEQPRVSAATLSGIWSLDQSRDPTGELVGDARGLLLMFGSDGAFALEDEGNIDTSPDFAGSYELEGDVVVTHRVRGQCTEAIDFTAAMPEDGRLHTVVTDAGSGGGCAMPVGTESEWIRVSPISTAGSATITTVFNADDTQPPAIQSIFGIWHREGSGQLLRFGIDGTYAVDDGGVLTSDPDDTGTYEINGATISFTSAGSATCAAGDAQVWDGVTLATVGLHEEDLLYTRLLGSTASESECSIHASGAQKWLRISP